MNGDLDERWSGLGCRGTALAVLLVVGLSARAGDDVPVPRSTAADPKTANAATQSAPVTAASSTEPQPLDLGKSVIAAAVAEAKEPHEPKDFGRAGVFGTTPTTAQQKIDRAFKDAEIPTCMTMDAWKFEPPRIGPIDISGLFAAPWLVHVIATGRCRH